MGGKKVARSLDIEAITCMHLRSRTVTLEIHARTHEHAILHLRMHTEA